MSLLGGLLSIGGALLGGASSRGGGSQTVTNNVPPEFSPLASFVAQRGQQLGNLPFTPLPFNPVASFNPYQFAGFDMTMNRAMGPNALVGNAESSLADTLGGKYLDSNPYIDSIVSKTLDDVQGRMGALGMGSGSFGNANVAKTAAEGMSNAANQIRFQNYGQERDRMMSGLGFAPSIYGLGYAPAQQMLGIGGIMQQQAQQQLDAARQEFDRAQDWPFRTYQAAMAPFGTNIGSQQTTTGPRGNVAAGLLGGALAGGQLWNIFNRPQDTTGVF